MRLWIFILALTIANLAHADAKPLCKEHLSPKSIESAPLCPESQVLSEMYPTAAITISDIDGGSDYVASVVKEVLIASPDRPPQIIFSGRPFTLDYIKKMIAKMDGTPEQKKKWLLAVTRVQGKLGFNWQQDFFQASFNPETGNPALRELNNYDLEAGVFLDVQRQVTLSCAIEMGDPLETPKLFSPTGNPKDAEYLASGYYGGNIEAMPPNFCVVGSADLGKDWDRYSKNACGEKADRIKAPTSWLRTGHVDEIVKTIPLKGPGPCNFAVAMASPRKAFEILKKNPNLRAADFIGSKNDETTDAKYLTHRSLKGACMSWHLQKGVDQQDKSSNQRKVGWLNQILIPNAKAKTNETKDSMFDAKCARMTNKELLESFPGDTEEFNQLVQEKLDAFSKDLKAKFKSKLPACDIKIVEVPNLFLGDVAYDESDGRTLLGNETGNSVFPNAANALFVDGTMIFSDPQNEALRKYLKDAFAELGVKSGFVDTEFAHNNGGNLHCATQSLQYCKPRGKK